MFHPVAFIVGLLLLQVDGSRRSSGYCNAFKKFIGMDKLSMVVRVFGRTYVTKVKVVGKPCFPIDTLMPTDRYSAESGKNPINVPIEIDYRPLNNW
jgi:hypothetical protein